MRFLTLSEQEIKNSRIYNSIKEKHIVISITSAADQEVILPTNINRVSELFLKFDDVQDIDSRFIYFDRDMSKQILDFVETYINNVSLIIVQCQAGISRSVAVASALSKIINYADDAIYTSGIPNMFVYVTILDDFFGDRNWRHKYSRITNHRRKAMDQWLSQPMIRTAMIIDKKRENSYE